MKKMSMLKKIILSVLVLVILFFAISIIDSFIFNKEKKGKNDKYFHITYMLVDKDKVSDDFSFDSFSHDMVNNLEYVYHFYQTEVSVEKDEKYYVADISNMNKVVLDNISDSYFSVTNLNAQTIDDIKFDSDKLKVYIPKKYYEDDKYRYEGTNNEVLDKNSPVQAEFLSKLSNKDYAKVKIKLNKTKFNTKSSTITIDNDTSYTKVKINKDNTNLSNKDYKVYINDDKYPLDRDKYTYSSKTGELKIDYYPIQINKIDIKYRKLSLFSILGLNDAEASVNPIIGTYSGTFTVGMEETYFLPYMYGSEVANRNATCSPTTYLYCGGQISNDINCASLASNWVSKQRVCTAWQSYMNNSVIASDGLRAFALRLVNQPGGSGNAESITEIADVPVSFNYDWLNADCETHFTSFNNSNAALPVSFRVTEVDSNGVVTIEFNSKYSSGGQLAGGRFRLKRGTPQAKAKPGVNIFLNKTYEGQDYSNAVFGYTIDGEENYLNSQAKTDYMNIFNVMQSIYTALGQGEDRKGIIHNTTLVYNAGGLNTRVSGGYLSYITDTIAKEHALEGTSLTNAKRAVGEILLGSAWSATDAEIEKMTWSQVVYSTLQLNILRGTASEIVSTENCNGANILDTDSSLACDATTDNNLRFIGNNPNNYVSFNGEKWRIVGFMNNIKSNASDTKGETRIKLIRESIGKDRYERYSNSYATSAINTRLNETYYNGMTSDAKALIDNITWNIGGFALWTEGRIATVNEVYNIERGNIGPESTPNITTWKGNIGLIHPTDYYFAHSGSTNEDRQRCVNTTIDTKLSLMEDCYTNNWLGASDSDGYWTINGAIYSESDWTPGEPDGIYVGYHLIIDSAWGPINQPYGFIGYHTMYWGNKALRPTVYLKPDAAIASGTGTYSDPYVFGNASNNVNIRYSATTNEASDATNGDTTIYEGSFGDVLTLNGVDRASADFYVKELITDDTGIVMDDRIYKISVSYVANDPTTEAGLKTGTYSYTVYRSNDATNWQTMYTKTLTNQNIENFPTIRLTNQDAHFNDPENGDFENTGDCCDDLPKYGAIKVKKELERAEPGDSLTGYKFKVHNVSNNTDSYIYTDATGVATYGYILGNYSLKVGTSYEISEVVDNDGYAIRLVDGVEKSSNFKPRDNTTKNIVISSDTVNDFYVVSYSNYKDVYCAKVVKVDSETNKPLKGATFTLSDGQTGVSDQNGVVIFTNLNNSSYTVTETTPNGTILTDSDGNTYEYYNDDPTPKNLTIVAENYSEGAFSCPLDVPTSFTHEDTKVYYCLKVKKTDATNGVALQGAVFEISSAGKTPVENEATTNNDGIASLFIGDSSKAGTYDIEETVAPEGYDLLPIIQNVDTIAMEHFNSENEAKEACKTDTVKDINGELISAVTYDSYNGDNSYVFKDNKQNNVLLNFFKVNENNNYINGAEFKALNSNGKYITVSSNKSNITDASSVVKNCYIYTGANNTGSSLYMDDVSPDKDGSMAGEICIAGLPSGNYIVSELNPVDGHTFTSSISKTLSTSTSFRTRTDDFINQPTKLVFTKQVVDKDGQGITNLDEETINDIISINFNIYEVNDNGEKVGSKIEVIKTADGVYEYANNTVDGVTGTVTTDLHVRSTDFKFEVYHLPYGKYMVEEDNNISGYYIVNKDYSLFEINKCSNTNINVLRCTNSNYAEASLDNTITEIEFTKKDIYEYYKNTDNASSVNNDKLFDTINFVLRDKDGNILSLIDLGNGNYKYGSGGTENTIHTTNGSLKITKLPRNSTYYIEEISSDVEGNFVLRTDLTYDNLPFDNQGHPVVIYNLDDEIEISTYISKTGVIQNTPTRVIFEKKDAKYGYTILDEATTFNVYQCTNLQEGEHCTEANGTLINFETRGVITGDEEDTNIEVYKYKKNNASGVTDLHPYNGKLVLRYLPSDSKYSYVLVETKAPEGYLLPTNGDQYTEFEVSNNDVNGIAVAVNNQPTGILIYKYSTETGNPLPGAKFKIYKVTNYDSTKTLEEQEKEVISLKVIRDGEYEYSNVPTTDIMITCDDNNGVCEKENPKTIAGGLFRNGTILIEYLPNDTYYIIEEVEAPNGYKIDENNKYKLIYLEENETSVEYTSVYNETKPEYYCLKVKKVDYVTNEPLQDATFEITKDGVTPEESTATSNASGIASFFIGDSSKAGTYTIRETVAPEGYDILRESHEGDAINIGYYESAEEAKAACKTETVKDINGNLVSSVTYDSNNGDNSYTFKDNKNEYVLLNFFKVDEKSNRENNAKFKIKDSSGKYITVDNEKVNTTDSSNVTKKCYLYTGANESGSILTSDDVSVNQDGTMNGEVCISKLNEGTYTVEEILPIDNHTFDSVSSKNIDTSRSFRTKTDDFINKPTKLIFTKHVVDETGQDITNLDEETINDIISINFNIYKVNDNGEKVGSKIEVIKTADGVYEYANNTVDGVTGTVTTDLHVRSTDFKFEVYHLPYGKYMVEEDNNISGYYIVNKDYSLFEINKCSNTNINVLRCTNSNYAEASLDNTITEIEFTKKDIYEYYKNTDNASSVNNDKLFDTINFVLRDKDGNILSLIDLGNGNYKYGSGGTENTIHTTNGSLKITKLPRNSTYYIEEISSDVEGNFVLRTDLTYDNLPFDNQGHPVVIYNLDDEIEISTYISKTGVIQNTPTRVIFEKKDAKYGYTILDEATTFNVYQCTNLQEGEHCTEANGTLINFETRGVITGDEEDTNIEVYKYKKNNASGVTDLHPYNGKLVLRYLPSDSKYSYVLVETKAPEGYLLPTNGDQYTEFEVSNNDVNGIAVAVNNQPTGILIYKYSTETGNPLPGAKFKIYKVTNYDSTKTLEEQEKEVISLKVIRDGEYEYSNVPTTDIMITCDDNNGVCEKENPKTIAGGLFRNGTILIEYLPNDTYYIIEEVEAPLGYEIDENNKYKLIYLEENETSVKFTSVYNTPKESPEDYYCLKVKKTDKVTNEGLGGAVFTISNPTKTPVMSSAVTNSEGIASFFIGTIDNVADYTVTETKAPNGYYLNNSTLTVRPIKLATTESAEEARNLCLTNNATDSEGVIISSYTYNSNDPTIRSKFIISNNKSLLNIYKKDNNNNGVSNVTFKIKKDNSYIVVKDLNNDNEITLDDRVSTSDGNSTKLCYVYDSLDNEGSNLISGDVSIDQDNSMSGELCVSSLQGNEESTADTTYIVKEISSTETLINKREEKEITSSRYFQASGDLNTFINYPTYVKLIKNVDNTYSSSEGSGLSDITTNELMNIPFTINDSNGNPVPITMNASGEYIYDSNSSNTVMYINQSREIVVRGLPKGNYTFIELNNDECQSGVDSIGYYNQTRSYPFTIDDCSSETGFDTETCQNRITTVDMLNIPTELDFTKKDFYSDETGTFVDDKERSDFDKIGFKVKDKDENYIRFIKIGNNGTCNDDDSYSIYRAVYDNSIEGTVDTLNTCGGHIKILNLHRGETYTIEEISVPDDSIYVLEGHPSITVKIGCEGEVGRTSTTAVISDKPSRVVFEKKDAKYGYTILDETTTFNVYRCEIGSVCNSNTGELVHFYERDTIENDEEDSNIEVYKYNRNTDGITDLHPYNGKVVLRYLPSGYDYILVETKAPNGYLLPVLDAAITRFEVKTDTVDIEEVNVPNLPVGLVIRKYDENGNLLSGAEFKVYKVNNYNPELSLENQDKTELSFKIIIQGVYENRPVLDTNIISVSNVDINNSYYDYENLDEVYTKSGSKLKDVLKKGTAFISYLENNSYYIVEETKAPKGYTISDNKYTLVHIGENETQIADIEDAFINYPSVYTFYKIDEYNNPLDGAEFVLQKLNRNKVYETLNVTLVNNIYKVSNETENKIITTTNGKASIYYLEEGQYRILEVKNKAGYELNKDNNYSATFFVDRDGLVHGEQIIVNKKPTNSEETMGNSQASLILNIQTGQKVISYLLMIFGTLGVIILLIILVKRNNLKKIFSFK